MIQRRERCRRQRARSSHCECVPCVAERCTRLSAYGVRACCLKTAHTRQAESLKKKRDKGRTTVRSHSGTVRSTPARVFRCCAAAVENVYQFRVHSCTRCTIFIVCATWRIQMMMWLCSDDFELGASSMENCRMWTMLWNMKSGYSEWVVFGTNIRFAFINISYFLPFFFWFSPNKNVLEFVKDCFSSFVFIFIDIDLRSHKKKTFF